MGRKITISALMFLWISFAFAQEKKYVVHTIAFYNIENLYDTINDPKVNDEEFLPYGEKLWDAEKYKQKLENIATVIADIGADINPDLPTIVGLAETENRGVLEDLVQTSKLAGAGYGIIHFDSPDKRGIDVALLYKKNKFKPISYISIPLIIEENSDAENEGLKRKFTRSQLLVTGLLEGEEISFIVNHWPSRYGGEKKSRPYRDAAGILNRKIVDSLYTINPNAKIITMGDFNDGPYNNSVRMELRAKDRRAQVKPQELYNPMGKMARDGLGSTAYRDNWSMFDQIILSEPLIRKDFSTLQFWRAGVYNKTYITQVSGQYKGYPLRNRNGEVGYSDHFPVYVYLIKEI